MKNPALFTYCRILIGLGECQRQLSVNLSQFYRRDFLSVQRNLRESLSFLEEEKKRDLRQKVLDLSSQNRAILQLCEALGDHNRWLASENLGHPASDNEAFLHYVSNGGKTKFDQNHPLKG